MDNHNRIQFELVKLAGGERLLRLMEPLSGLALEKKLDPAAPVIRQKKKLLRVFEAALSRAEMAGA